MATVLKWVMLLMIIYCVFDVHGDPPKVKVKVSDSKLKITNVRHNGQAYKSPQWLTIMPHTGSNFHLWDRTQTQWNDIGQFIHGVPPKDKMSRVYFNGATKKVYSDGVFGELVRKRMVKYATHVIKPLYDTYYVISAHGLQLNPSKGSIDWKYRSTIKFLVASGHTLKDKRARQFQEHVELGKITQTNTFIAETVVTGGRINEHWAEYAAGFNDVGGVYRYTYDVSSNRPVVSTDLLATFTTDTHKHPVLLTEIVNALDALGTGTIYWNACRKTQQQLPSQPYGWEKIKLAMYDPRILIQRRAARLKDCKEKEEKDRIIKVKTADEVIQKSKELLTKHVQGNSQENIKSLTKEQKEFETWVIERKSMRKGTPDEFTAFTCDLWAYFQYQLMEEIGDKYAAFEFRMNEAKGDDWLGDFDIGDHDASFKLDGVKGSKAREEFDNNYFLQSFDDDDKLLEKQEIMDNLRIMHRIARKSKKKKQNQYIHSYK